MMMIEEGSKKKIGIGERKRVVKRIEERQCRKSREGWRVIDDDSDGFGQNNHH